MSGDDGLELLLAGHLDTVSFVMDYVEFRINYNVLRALNPPAVRLKDGATSLFPEPGSRDALCRLIDGQVVRAAIMGDAQPRIEIETDAGHVLTISLDTSEYPEAAHLVPADERGRLRGESMYIW